MSDNEALLTLFALLYALECCVWLGRDCVVFGAAWGGDLRPAAPHAVLGNRRLGLVIGSPLPPLGELLPCPASPVSLTRMAAYAYVPLTTDPAGRPPQSERLVLLDRIESLATPGSGEVRVNGEVFVRTATPGAAAGVAEMLERLRSLPEAGRERVLDEATAAAFEPARVSGRVEAWRRAVAPLRIAACALFVHLFLATPWLVFHRGLERAAVPALAVLAVLEVLVAGLFYRAHAKLRSPAKWERVLLSLAMCVYPPLALRAHDRLAIGVLDGCAPLAAASVLCSAGTFREYARRALLDARHPRLPACPSEDAACRAASEEARRRTCAAMEALLRRLGLDPDELTRPAERATDPSVLAYCPRCQAGYTMRDATCADCGGMPLQAR
ncbi:MAG: hypothetical protein HYZ53_02195 [Planctomycetes bacterium]|nr:hypothetical protein [Planctomycetota bacterium]